MYPLTWLPVLGSSVPPALNHILSSLLVVCLLFVRLPSHHHLAGRHTDQERLLQDDDLDEDDSDPEQSAASGFVVADGHLSDSEGFQDPEELEMELEGACYLIDNCTSSRGPGASSRSLASARSSFHYLVSC